MEEESAVNPCGVLMSWDDGEGGREGGRGGGTINSMRFSIGHHALPPSLPPSLSPTPDRGNTRIWPFFVASVTNISQYNISHYNSSTGLPLPPSLPPSLLPPLT